MILALIHFGEIQEISVAGFTKATGREMIVAHKLLKNDIPVREHILVTEAGTEVLGTPGESGRLRWEKESSEYEGVGEVRYDFASLEPLLELVPPVPPRPNDVKRLGENSFTVEVDRPMAEVYRVLLDMDTRDQWTPSVLEIERGAGVPRRGFGHVCHFEGLTVEFETVGGEVGEAEIIYVEQGWIKELGIAIRDTFNLRSLGPDRTEVILEIHWPASDDLPEGCQSKYPGLNWGGGSITQAILREFLMTTHELLTRDDRFLGLEREERRIVDY